MKKLRDIGEDALIQRLIKHAPQSSDLCEGPGDDCAVVSNDSDTTSLQLLKTDAMVEGIHYEISSEPHRVGKKAISRVISDFAAMGGTPERFLITIALPPDREIAWVEDLYKGMGEQICQYDALLAGGETCSIPEGSSAVISVSATGRVPAERLVTRSGGNIGDKIIVTGKLGGSIKGKHLDFTPRIKEAKWLATHYKPSAMMDVSDGLAKDLTRLAHASGCGIQLKTDSIPITDGCSIQQALTDGEDYELLMTMNPDVASRMMDQWTSSFPSLPITVIGELVSLEQGQQLDGGWEHFKPASG